MKLLDLESVNCSLVRHVFVMLCRNQFMMGPAIHLHVSHQT